MDNTDNYPTDLEKCEVLYGETIEAIVVGQHSRKWDGPVLPDENVVLSRDEGLAKLDQDFEVYKGCFPMYAWTASYIFLIHEYDGATSIAVLPRHPVECRPTFGGDSPISKMIENRKAEEAAQSTPKPMKE